MLKQEARRMFRQKRQALPAAEAMKLDDLLLIQFQQLPLPDLHYLLSFYPLDAKQEINSFPITDYLRFRHPVLQVAYPRTDVIAHSMEAVLADEDTEFSDNAYGIPEPVRGDILPPEAMDLVLIPLLAFDEKGHRVGYGKGYYDRYLSRCRPDCLKVGLSQFSPVDRIDDAGEFDIPLDLCITPHRAYVF